MRVNRGNTKKMGLAAIAVAVLTVVAACGDSGSDNNGGTNNAGDASEQVKAAEAAVAKAKEEPKTVRVTESLKAKPATGKSFYWLKCDVSQCKDIGDGLREATAAVGWTYKELNYKSADPATLVAAMRQALRQKADAVGLSGIPAAAGWQSVIASYKKANVPIVTGYIGPQVNTFPVIGQTGGDPDVKEYGQMIGNWFIADSKGTGKAVLLSVNDFPVLKTYSTAFKNTVKNGCSGCKVTEVNVTIPQVFGGKTVPPLISAMQKDKTINYVITSNGPFISGLLSALSAAGLAGKVRVGGESGDVETLQFVKQGKYQAFTGLALHYSGWLMLDMVLRHAEQTAFEADGDGGLPKQLLTPEVTFEIANSYDKPSDFRDQFKKLWKVA